MGNPYLDRLGKGEHGTKAEKKTAKRLGGKLTPASGASHEKADFNLEEFKVENKSTIYGSMSIKKEWLIKVSDEALAMGMYPALAIQFVDGDGRPVDRYSKWVMIPEVVFAGLVE